MAFTINTIDISSSSPALVSLAGREYEKDYTSLPNSNLPVSMRKDLNVVYSYLTDEELPLDENTFLVKAQDSVFSRLFGPVLKVGSDGIEGTQTDKLYIQWGPRFIPLEFNKEGFFAFNGNKIEAEFGKFNFSGRGEDAALFISIDEEEGQTVLPVAVRFSDWENPLDPKAMNVLSKKKPQEILNALEKVKEKSGAGRISQDVEINLKEDLELNTEYEVVGYYRCKTTYGISFRILINNYPEENTIAGTWAHNSFKPLLATDPEITPEKPATLIIKDRKVDDKGVTKIRCMLVLPQQQTTEEELNLDF